MIIDGKGIAETILVSLTETVTTLKKNDITPSLAVILVGDDLSSLSYIKQKQKAAERIGAKLLFEHMPSSITPVMLESAIAHYNNDPLVHGIIIQRPVPQFVGEVGDILMTVHPAKDVDGFLPHSPFEVPVARAVVTMIMTVYNDLIEKKLVSIDFIPWLRQQRIAIIGRGETAGKPIAALFQKYDCATSIIHSKTPHPAEILKRATIIISCVGKERIITRSMITKGVILISVGLCRGSDGKLHGDYEEEEIRDTALWYSPTPGGVGPVNVASLMHNLVDATLMTLDAK